MLQSAALCITSRLQKAAPKLCLLGPVLMDAVSGAGLGSEIQHSLEPIRLSAEKWMPLVLMSTCQQLRCRCFHHHASRMTYPSLKAQ